METDRRHRVAVALARAYVAESGLLEDDPQRYVDQLLPHADAVLAELSDDLVWPTLTDVQRGSLALAEYEVRKSSTRYSVARGAWIDQGAHHLSPTAIALEEQRRGAATVADLLGAWRRASVSS